MIVLKYLAAWFNREKRDLPWRVEIPNPYAVWVSEVMLQQTQVKTVIPYFLKWMEIFPTIQDLAEAKEEVVIKAWEGLGYYSRARNLHQGAKTCLEQFQGQLPKNYLDQIKGIGPYTRGAILSFAFHQKAAAIDGNVTRVLSRLMGKDLSKFEMEKVLLDSLPDHKPWETMEAMIELGATICTKKPICQTCPMRSECLAYRSGTVNLFPTKKKAAEVIKLTRHALLLEAQGHILLKKTKPGQIMAGLWEFPYFENILPHSFEGLNLQSAKPLSPVTHTFTRYKVTLILYRLVVKDTLSIDNYEWIRLCKIGELPFSSGHRKLIALVHS